MFAEDAYIAEDAAELVDVEYEPLTPITDPEEALASRMRNQRLAHELALLPEPVRIALVLQLRDGLSYDEIAAQMQITTRMVKRYLLSAFATLRASVPPDL